MEEDNIPLTMLTFLKLKKEKQDPTLSRLTVFGRVLEDVNSIYYFDVHSTDRLLNFEARDVRT